MNDYAQFVASKMAVVSPCGITDVGDLSRYDLMPHQVDLAAWGLRRGRAAIFADTGLGKAQPVDEPVLTPSGWRPIGSLAVGDEVISVDGLPTRIIGVYPQGARPIVTVGFNDGAAVRCDQEHLWTVATDLDISRGVDWRTMTIQAIFEKGLADASGRHRWRIPVVSPINHKHADLPVDPYVLGVLLGDGSFRKPSVQFVSADPEIAHEVERRLPAGMRMSVDPNDGDRTQSYRLVVEGYTNRNKTNPYLDAIKAWGLQGHLAHTKFIPDEYLTASIDQRLDLLRGIMDTDGYVSSDGTVQFGSSSPQLADGVLSLVRSLGGIARRSSKMPTYVHNGERRAGRECHTLTIAMPDGIVPFFLGRKVARCADRYYAPQRKIVSVTPSGDAECVCIAVEHESSLYITSDYVVTHNTRMQLAWADQVASATRCNVLILAPLAVAAQTVEEGVAIGVDVTLCREAEDVRPGINITNYDRLHKFDTSRFDAVVLDESSCIKHHDTKTLARLLEAFKDTPYKLCATATPAPNDWTELGTHAEFLGVCTRAEMLAEYFVHDGGETQVWRLKGHAREQFWRWVSGWGAMVRKPSDLGHDDSAYNLPPLVVTEHTVESAPQDSGLLFAVEAQTLSERRHARKASIDARVAECAAAVNAEPGEPWIVWCDLNAEADALCAAIHDAVEIRGPDDPDLKERRLADFAAGRIRVLVTKCSIAGWGVNWQHCARVAFVGVTDSFEAYYQAVRRCWRFGQKREVQVHIFASEAEGSVVANLRRKEADAQAMADALSAETRDAVRSEVLGQSRHFNPYTPDKPITAPAWLVTEKAA